MDGIKIEVTGNIARIIERPARITAGTVGLPVEFSFDNQWEGLSKTAVFKAGCTEKIVENLEAETAVPWEVTANPNVWLSIGVYGVNANGSVAIPTIWANVCVICEGANPDGDVSTAPTLPVWQRLWNSIGNLLGLTTNAKGNLVEAINEVNNIALAGGIESDPTLSQSGKAADAKATGDAIKSLTAEDVGAAPIPHSASGEVIAVGDSAHAPLQGLKIYGKTTQSGTPTPTTPVHLKSAGESGSIGVTVAGKNLLDLTSIPNPKALRSEITALLPNEITLTAVSDSANQQCEFYLYDVEELRGKTFTFSCGDFSNTDSAALQVMFAVQYSASATVGEHAVYHKSAKSVSFTVKEETVRILFIFRINQAKPSAVGTVAHWGKLQLEVGNSATEYEPYKDKQTLTASTEGGLHGIGDVCDEIDFARGVRVQRMGRFVVTADDIGGIEGTTVYTTKLNDYLYSDKLPALCNRFTKVTSRSFSGVANANAAMADGQCGHWYLVGNTGRYFYFKSSALTDLATAKAWFAANETVIYYPLAEPIETPLSAEELAAYAALHSHKPNTTAFNDSGADMEIRYCTPNAAVPMNVGSGAKGKVLAVDEHGCVVPKDVTSIGAAPAGFGYRDTHDDEEAFMEVVENCLSQMSSDEVRHVSIAYYGRHSVMIHKHINGYASIEDITYTWDTSYSKRVRTMYNNVWKEWEWVNPPMATEVEYRTTERWGEHAVYTTLIDCGTPPSKSTKSITMPSYVAPTRIIGWSGYVGHWGVSLPATASGWDVQITSDIIAIATDSDRSFDSTDNKVYITIKYTKD